MESYNFSRIAAGVWKWGEWGHRLSTAQIQELIEVSIGVGITSFDHADIYGHYTDEAAFGVVLARQPSLRQQMQLVTKCGIQLVTPNRPSHKVHSYNTSREHIVQSAETSLRNLHTDVLDLLLIHRPDPLMDPDEIAEAFDALRQQGKVKHFGVSNFTPSQFTLLQSRTPLVTNQVEASLLRREPFLDGTFDQCITHRIQPMVWSPLGSGRIFTAPDDPQVLRIHAAAQPLCEQYQVSLDQLLLAWLLKHPSRLIPVLGTAQPARIQAAAAALSITLTREEWFTLWVAAAGEDIP
ncbi:aldo/keto reductase [Chitinophaga pendula]|uniref:aldo/keto reductase n=1 Tax=Chitinophaga TaxID=79328 RepID=UPI000BB079D0|nr:MULTISPECIES: aldo/keto reductase [Chitinophaga]ASZ11988.1 oxidoreductase [Chitinophaga sp. MD30]UCJ04984.1 aldo/keto reductase [Chitinophaga pendula]